MIKIYILSLLAILTISSLNATTIEDVIDDVYNGREETGVDLSQANPDYQYFFYHHISFRDNPKDEFQDYRERKPKFIPLSPNLLAILYYWSGHIPLTKDKTKVTLEQLYIFNLRVVGTTLIYHHIYANKSWIQGKTPSPLILDVVWDEEFIVNSEEKRVYYYKIGKREFRITTGFLVD